MAKKPKGLKKAEDSLKHNETFDLSKIMILGTSSYSDVSERYKDYKEMESDKLYQGYELATTLAGDIAEDSFGFRHKSDVLDEALDFEFREFAKLNKMKTDESSSDGYDESSDQEVVYRGDHSEAVSESFKEKISEALNSGSMVNFESFKALYTLAKDTGFSGSEKDFETYLKQSWDFREFCKVSTCRYRG